MGLSVVNEKQLGESIGNTAADRLPAILANFVQELREILDVDIVIQIRPRKKES
jgi:hypothetical protein